MNYTESFDAEFDKIDFYKKYPIMRPFVGCHYQDTDLKILIIAESHYLPQKSTIHLNAEKWFKGDDNKMNECEQKWVKTRNIIGGENMKAHTIYRNLAKALVETGFPDEGNAFRSVAFMNAFQRPARCKKSIKVEKIDLEVSRQVVQSVVDILRPDAIIFTSTKAAKKIGKHITGRTYRTPHPACGWWGRASKKGTGKAQFMQIIHQLRKNK